MNHDELSPSSRCTRARTSMTPRWRASSTPTWPASRPAEPPTPSGCWPSTRRSPSQLRAYLEVMNLAERLAEASVPRHGDVARIQRSRLPGAELLTTLGLGPEPAAASMLRELPDEPRAAGQAAIGRDARRRRRSLGRYQLQGEIARGGMGAILKGRDVDLGRDLAIKVLLESHQGNPEIVRRFVEEAQIGGQLQHPGIVPVYELGTFADRRPYLRHEAGQGPDPGRAAPRTRPTRHEDLPRFLSIFEQVCQTMAYAHARGVIHRDLKPSNVMVGSFGEVQVMDWGLAKVLPHGGIADEAAAQPVAAKRSS